MVIFLVKKNTGKLFAIPVINNECVVPYEHFDTNTMGIIIEQKNIKLEHLMLKEVQNALGMFYFENSLEAMNKVEQITGKNIQKAQKQKQKSEKILSSAKKVFLKYSNEN